MNPQLSPEVFNQFFAWAPLALGIVIYGIFYVAKRHETSPAGGNVLGQTFACAGCGRRGSREHMLPQQHDGAVSWYCTHCASR